MREQMLYHKPRKFQDLEKFEQDKLNELCAKYDNGEINENDLAIEIMGVKKSVDLLEQHRLFILNTFKTIIGYGIILATIAFLTILFSSSMR